MSKHDILGAAELGKYQPNAYILEMVERYRAERGLQPAQIRVLDWGCGRGRMVFALRQRGYQGYGVDRDAGPVANAAEMASFLGLEPGDVLRVLSRQGGAPFPDGYFDFVVSDQVLEHVSDISQVLEEIARVTRPEGWGLHCYPAHRSVLETHLRMPLVHWLPKGAARRHAIAAFVRIGVEPRWPEVREPQSRSRAAVYFRYSVEKTFYRKPGEILEQCRRQGLEARFVSMDAGCSRPGRRRTLCRLLPATLHELGNRVVTCFRSAYLFTRKSPVVC